MSEDSDTKPLSGRDEGRDLAFWELDASSLHFRGQRDWKRGDPVIYVNDKIPDFAVPAYDGDRYEAMVPDTLDLQERAALAIAGMTEPTDPLADYEVYFFAYVLANPPMMQHSFDYHCTNKFMEAMPLLRMISGSSLDEQVDRRWMEVALHQQGTDGLLYVPVRGRPWAYLGVERLIPEHAWGLDHFISPCHCGRMLSALTLYHLRDKGSIWRNAAERLVDGLSALAVDAGQYAYFGPHYYWAERGCTVDPATKSPHNGLETRGAILGLTHVYRELGYEPAIQLAGKLVHYVLDVCQGFDSEGRFNGRLGSVSSSGAASAMHFHLHAYTLGALLEYALVTDDDALVELVRKGYEYGKSQGDTVLGYFPEFVNSERLEHSETCEVADMIALGVKLSEAGVGDYWDDVDRWVRNMFAEAQLRHTDWIDRLHLAAAGETREMDVLPSQVDPRYQTTDRVAERNRGSFAGWPRANDWYSGQGMGVMHCCTGNAARAIHYVWDRILWRQGDKLEVNLLLNRASPWADIDGHIPYTGQVDIRIKQESDLSVRIPEWVKPDEVRCTVNGQDRAPRWDRRYAIVGQVKPGATVVLEFPINEHTEMVYVQKERYTLVRKGNEVVSIEPAGRYYPLYQRRHYRKNTTRWTKVERFVSDKIIHW